MSWDLWDLINIVPTKPKSKAPAAPPEKAKPKPATKVATATEVRPEVKPKVEPKPRTKTKPKPRAKTKPKPRKPAAPPEPPKCDFEIKGKALAALVRFADSLTPAVGNYTARTATVGREWPQLRFGIVDKTPIAHFFTEGTRFWSWLDEKSFFGPVDIKRPVSLPFDLARTLSKRKVVRLVNRGDKTLLLGDGAVQDCEVDVTWSWKIRELQPPDTSDLNFGVVPGLGKAIQAAYMFCAPEKTHYALNQILLDGEAGNVVATDGKRMIVVDVDLNFPDSHLLPNWRFLKLKSPISESSETLFAIQADRREGRSGPPESGALSLKPSKWIYLAGGQAIVGFKLDDKVSAGNFPPYREVMPPDRIARENNYQWHTVFTEQFRKEAEKALKAAPKGDNNANPLVVCHPDRWECHATIDGEKHIGPVLSIKPMWQVKDAGPVGINRKYLQELMKWSLKEAGFRSSDAPMVFKGGTGLNYTIIVMPISLPERG